MIGSAATDLAGAPATDLAVDRPAARDPAAGDLAVARRLATGAAPPRPAAAGDAVAGIPVAGDAAAGLREAGDAATGIREAGWASAERLADAGGSLA
jgi:hypothetical protein